MRIGAAELVSSDIALHLNNETETFKSAKQEMKVLSYGIPSLFLIITLLSHIHMIDCSSS